MKKKLADAHLRQLPVVLGCLIAVAAFVTLLVMKSTDWRGDEYTYAEMAAAIAGALRRTSRCFEIINARLATSRWLAGDAFSIADIAAGVALHRWSTIEVERPVMPNVVAWHERLAERQAFRDVVCRPYEELRGRLAF